VKKINAITQKFLKIFWMRSGNVERISAFWALKGVLRFSSEAEDISQISGILRTHKNI
jgi:hypothetical protein